ncbi:hypothetical protein [Streptomyces sp. NPDC003036]|uniref:hypothetical protein n=1 Tax=Streptomyces sp. NPDC003036 TaxID=3154442 RepID=UPI0033BF15E5
MRSTRIGQPGAAMPGPAGAAVFSASASARQTEVTEGCCPAFFPVLTVTFLAISGFHDQLLQSTETE